MEGNKQSSVKRSKKSNIASKTALHKNIFNNRILFELEECGFTTPDDKVEELIKELTEIKYLYALKILFETPLNQFSPQVLQDSLVALVDPASFAYCEKQSVARLELHIRTWAAVLEQICVTSLRLSKNLQDKVYDSLAKFAEIHRKTIQVMTDNKYRTNFNQFNQQVNKESEVIIKKQNYNIDFLLIHLRDTLQSLRDDEIWLQEILRRTKELLSAALNFTSSAASRITPNDTSSISSMLIQLRQGLNFRYPVASYHVDWRIMLIIQHNLFKWSENSEISEKLKEMVLTEYLWSYLDREWSNVADKSILGFQFIFDEVSNRVLRNAGSILNDVSENEPLTLPHTLWFGILDLAQNLIQKSTRIATYGLCYYLAIESLNKAPSSFIQFKAIEILLHLYSINNELFSIIEIDFDHYAQKLDENNSEKFQKLLSFVKEKCLEDFNTILNGDIENGTEKGKGKSLNQDQTLNQCNILDTIADEITCPISSEPTDQLCFLKCQHILSSNNFKKLKQKKCPECRESIEDNDIRYLSQNTIYKNLYSRFFEAGYILPTIELESSGQIADNQYNSDSDNSEVDLILTKKKKFIYEMKLNSNRLLQSIFPTRTSKKQHPIHQNVMKELNEKNYEKAEYWCKEFLKKFPKSYSIRCILAYIYRCLNNYEQAHLYLNEAIELKERNPIAFYIYGEINFRQSNYESAIDNLKTSIGYKAKLNNLFILLGLSYLFKVKKDNNNGYYYYKEALKNFNIALQKCPNNYLCLKNCAYSHEKRKEYSNTLKMLDKLLNINKEDSLILCYYGEILSKMGRYNEAILYFTEASIIDPENVYNLNKRAIAYYILKEYDKALLDLNMAMQLDFSNSLTYYYKGLTYYTMEDISNAIIAFGKCIELDSNNDLAKMQFYYLKDLRDKDSSKDENYDMTKINQIKDDKSLLFIRCKIYIELKKYSEAKSDLDRLFELDEDISFVYLLRKYPDFWHLFEHNIKENDFDDLGIVNKFNIYMYKVKKVYFISNLINLDSKLHKCQENNPNSLSGQVFSFNDNLSLPKFSNIFTEDYSYNYYVVWKINVKKILSEDCFIKFVFKDGSTNTVTIFSQKEYILKYEDVSKLEGLGWIEYKSFENCFSAPYKWVQLSIEANKDYIEMQIDYVRIISHKYGYQEQICFPIIGHLLPFHKNHQNVPDTFEEKYFSKKEMENLLELKDIISNL